MVLPLSRNRTTTHVIELKRCVVLKVVWVPAFVYPETGKSTQDVMIRYRFKVTELGGKTLDFERGRSSKAVDENGSDDAKSKLGCSTGSMEPIY